MNQQYPRNKQASYSKHFEKLFKDTYWANHTPEGEEEKQLCMNRDLMAERYGLKKFSYYSSDFPKKYHKEMIVADLTEVERSLSIMETFNGIILYHSKREIKQRMTNWLDNYGNFMKHKDHPEYYTDSDKNIVSVFSKYIRDDDTEGLELIFQSGYKRIEPIYSLDQKTFIKVIFKL